MHWQIDLNFTNAPSMAETTKVTTEKRYAVVSGANKGIGFEICRKLAGLGITVVVAARDEKRGLEALQKLKDSSGLSGDLLIFHQLDVTDPASVASLAEFIKNEFGRLDILVNNAGISGVHFTADVLKVYAEGEFNVDLNTALSSATEYVEECLNINYYGTKRMTETFIPLLLLSQSPRIVNVSSQLGALELIPNEWAKGILSDADKLTEERVEEVLREYLKLKDFESNVRLSQGWPLVYHLSKATQNACTRIMAKKFPNCKVNCICPGSVKTDSNEGGKYSAEEGAVWPVKLALMPDDAPSGLFFIQDKVAPF